MDSLASSTSTPLCSKCSSSVLMTVPWETLVRQGMQEPVVVHTWRIESSHAHCSFCNFFEEEVRANSPYPGLKTLFESFDNWAKNQGNSIEQNKEVRDLDALLALHPGSDLCGVCYAAELVRQKGPEAVTKNLLWRLFDRNVPRNEMETMFTNHGRGRKIIERPDNPVPLIRKVEIILDINGKWPALRLQEYKRQEKLQNGSYDALAQLPDSELTKFFRGSTKNAYVLLPCLGRIGDARPFGSSLDPELIKSWIQQCKTSHPMCSQQRRAPFPTDLILIDTEDGRIVEIASGTEPPYLALSYVWGAASQPELTKATWERMSAKGGLMDLCVPQTILDAIYLAKLIGYRYLWVDALCIVQDDISIRHHTIAQMYNIYHGADVTVVAPYGSSCSCGIPGIGAVHRTCPIQNISGLPFMKLPASFKYGVLESKWKTRGWTFQEELCSQRLLVLLPNHAMFTCHSALYREDLRLEVSLGAQDSQDYREGFTLLSVTIQSLENSTWEEQIALFQGLVKQYMHRSFSREDDVENAFAGVSRMLEPVIGPSYHGIPEEYFVEIIHGCWFWDTSLERREGGFPSWSWVGWIYRPQHADMGIKAVAGQSTVLQFYRFDEDIQKLGQSSTPSETPSGRSLSKFEHFLPDETAIRADLAALQLFDINAGGSHMIAFTTSCATLSVGRLHYGYSSSMIREYGVFRPDTGKCLTSIRLHKEFVIQTGKSHSFIVIAYDESSDSFRLMLIYPRIEICHIVERVNVTVQNRLVRADDWMSLGPEKSTIIMQ